MRFCQADGTPLAEAAAEAPAEPLGEEPAFDPYATIVGKAPMPAETPVESAPEPSAELEAAAEPELHQTVGSVPISPPEDVLDLPSDDPLKTMYVSEDEMKEALGTSSPSEGDVVELPPIEETPSPEPPSFIAPEPPPAPSFGDVAPPPSPFSSSETPSEPMTTEPEFNEAATIIQPTFDPEPAPSAPAFEEPPTPSPFQPQAAAPVAEWTPPPAPDASWQNQEIGSNTPFQPPPAGVQGQNKTLAVVSLVLGIAGLTICCGGFIINIAAIVTGFMARSKAAQSPEEYGGGGMAMAGLITGIIGLVGSILIWIIYGGLILSSGGF